MEVLVSGKIRPLVVTKPTSKQMLDFMIEYTSPEFAELVRSFSHLKDLTKGEIHIIQTWNCYCSETKMGTFTPAGICDSRWFDPKKEPLARDQIIAQLCESRKKEIATAIHWHHNPYSAPIWIGPEEFSKQSSPTVAEQELREQTLREAAAEVATYRANKQLSSPKSIATKDSPKSVTTDSKESFSTAPPIDMASNNKDENQTLTKGLLKINQGLGASKWATNGEYNTKSTGSKQLLSTVPVETTTSSKAENQAPSNKSIKINRGLSESKWATGGEYNTKSSANKQPLFTTPIGAASNNKAENQAPTKEPLKINQGLSGSKWATGGEYNTKFSASKQPLLTTPTSVVSNEKGKNQALPAEPLKINQGLGESKWATYGEYNVASIYKQSLSKKPSKMTSNENTKSQGPSEQWIMGNQAIQAVGQQLTSTPTLANFDQATLQDLPALEPIYPSHYAIQHSPVTKPVVTAKQTVQPVIQQQQQQLPTCVPNAVSQTTSQYFPIRAPASPINQATQLNLPIQAPAAIRQTAQRAPSQNTLAPASQLIGKIHTTTILSHNELIEPVAVAVRLKNGRTRWVDPPLYPDASLQKVLPQNDLTQTKSTKNIAEKPATIHQHKPVEKARVSVVSQQNELSVKMVTNTGQPKVTHPQLPVEKAPVRVASLQKVGYQGGLTEMKNINTAANQPEVEKAPMAAQPHQNESSMEPTMIRLKNGRCRWVYPSIYTDDSQQNGPSAKTTNITAVQSKVEKAPMVAVVTDSTTTNTTDQNTARQLVMNALLSEFDRPTGFWPNPGLNQAKKEREIQLKLALAHEDDAQVLQQPASQLLTGEALLAIYGSKPRENDYPDPNDMVSNDGIAKEVIRAAQGTNELMDYDGKSWVPVPCDWENERPAFDGSFVPAYINEWRMELPFGSELAIDTSTQQFSMANEGINNGLYENLIIQPDSIPDTANSTDNMKRTAQTSAVDAHNYTVVYEKREQRKQKKAQRTTYIQAETTENIMYRPEESNPFSPKIPLYMRPVEEKDAAGIAGVYNHYIQNSVIPEDQEEFTVQDAVELIRASQTQKLPFIVSISGRAPSLTNVQGRRGTTQQSMLPRVEKVIGFAFSERLNTSLNCKMNGRSRFTCNLHLYVHPEYTRKGVGRNLMDRLMHAKTRSYAHKNAAEWINPRNDGINETEGSGTWHQMLINVPVVKTDDQTLTWLQPWLFHQNSFWFKEHYRMKSVARSNPNTGAAVWLDIAVFQCEATHAGVFGPYE